MSQCKVCGNTQGNIPHMVREMMFGTGKSYEYMECSACRCLQLVVPPETPSESYPDDYYSFSTLAEPVETGLSASIGNLRTRLTLSRKPTAMHRILRFIIGEREPYHLLRQLQFNLMTRYLDVGTGNGAFLSPLYNAGYRYGMGIDQFIDQDIVYRSGLRVRKGTIYDIDEQFDIIFYNHSFEHIEEQKQELEKVYDILDREGLCVISIPVFPSLAWDLFGANWYQIDAPRHYFLHSLESMTYLAQSAGFRVDSVSYNSTYAQFYISELYKEGIYLKDKGAKRGSFFVKTYRKMVYKRLAKRQNQNRYGDQAVFVLAKA